MYEPLEEQHSVNSHYLAPARALWTLQYSLAIKNSQYFCHFTLAQQPGCFNTLFCLVILWLQNQSENYIPSKMCKKTHWYFSFIEAYFPQNWIFHFSTGITFHSYPEEHLLWALWCRSCHDMPACSPAHTSAFSCTSQSQHDLQSSRCSRAHTNFYMSQLFPVVAVPSAFSGTGRVCSDWAASHTHTLKSC